MFEEEAFVRTRRREESLRLDRTLGQRRERERKYIAESIYLKQALKHYFLLNFKIKL